GNTVKSEFGIAGGKYLTIIAPSASVNKNQQYSNAFITNDSVLLDSILFKGDAHKESRTVFSGYSYYPSPEETEGKKYTASTNSIILQRQYRGKSDFKLFLNFSNNSDSKNIQYILVYDRVRDFIHSDILEMPSGSYYKDSDQIYNDFIKDVYLIANFEFVSKFNSESIRGDFQRLLKVQNISPSVPVCYTDGQVRADIYLNIYPYQNGSRAIVTAVISSRETNHIIDFSKDYDLLSNQLQKAVND
ncbi:MAG: hypothetical protein ABSG94_13010, partial [Brevinematales bacterium]